jgi:Immunity protein 30
LICDEIPAENEKLIFGFMDILQAKINKLHYIIQENDDIVDIDDFENILVEIGATNAPDYISQSLLLFDDNYQYHELMFSIIHFIEHANNVLYCEQVLATIPAFIQKAPDWASIVIMRILNSEEVCQVFIALCIHSKPIQKASIKHLLDQINTRGPEYLVRTHSLMDVVCNPFQK